MIPLNELLKTATQRLNDAGVEEAGLKVEWLLSQHLDLPRLEFPLYRDKQVDPAPLQTAIDRLCAHEPLQYVLGNTDFMGHTFKSDARALIPRPETEELVERVIALERTDLDVIDIGTGTGCIAISIALARPDWRVTASDISLHALALAKENAAALHAEKLTFNHASLLDALAPHSFDVIVSNPPYIANAEVLDLEQHIRAYEPHLALCGGPEGLDLIEKLINQARTVLRPGGLIFMEIGETQSAKTEDFLHKSDFTDILISDDRFGRTRFASGELHAKQ